MIEKVKTNIESYIEKIEFINGIYVPWFHGNWFGRDIGPNRYMNYPQCFFDENYVRKVFYNCKAIGFDMAKIWLNEEYEGMMFDETGSVIGAEPVFLKNLERIFEIASNIGLKLSICLVAHNECGCAGNKRLYDKLGRFYQVKSETEKFIENYVKPILSLAQKYGVWLIDIYGEPEAEGSGWNVSRGICWDSMVDFINRVSRAVKEFDSRMATTVSSGASCNTLLRGDYSRVEVDYYGADVYTNQGTFASTKDMLLNKPFMLGEYGSVSSADFTEDDQIELIKKFYNSCISNGAAGAFYWSYGWNGGGGGEMHIVDKNSNLRKVAAYLHFLNIDRKNKREGISPKDIPHLIITDTTDDIQWFGARNAENYILYVEENGKWNEILSIKAENYNDYPEIIHFSYSSAPETASYKVVALFADGEKTVSSPLILKKKVTYNV